MKIWNAAVGLLAACCVGSFACVASGGVAGGGGSTQTAPDSMQSGQPVVVKLELTVWGSGGDIKGRYTDIALRYRLATDAQGHAAVKPTLISADATHENYEFVIPAFAAGTVGDLEYYIELKLDGHPSRIEGIKKIKINA